MRTRSCARPPFPHRPLAVAAAITLLLGASLPVRAQLVSASGDVSPPVGAASSVNLTGQRIFLGFTTAGVGTPGSLSITGGGSLTAAQIVPGIGGLGVGTVSVSGAGSVINLTGGASNNGLDIGSWGTGTVTVSNGGLIACASTLACQFNTIGNAAGSTGTLAINGGTVSGLGQLAVGLGNVFTGFGTPGAATSATLSITNGGTLTSTGFNSVASNSAPTGPVTGNVTIDGAGSLWRITSDSLNPATGAFLGTASHSNATATIDITGGGKMLIEGRAGGTNNGINLTQGGVQGGGSTVMTVSGAGSELSYTGDNGFLRVGRSGAGGTASLNVENGGKVSGLQGLQVGRDGTTGTLRVDGAGSEVLVNGTTSAAADLAGGGTGVALPAYVVIGRGGGTGTVDVTNGGKITIVGKGEDAAAFSSVNRVVLDVARDSVSRGTLNITGPTAVVSVSQEASTVPGAAVSNPLVRIGRNGTGELNITGGGKLLIDGKGVAGGTLSQTLLYIGGSGSTDPGGSGRATVSGAGSEIRITGTDTFLIVGQGPQSSGRLDVTDGASVSALALLAGNSGFTDGSTVGGTGVVNINNATINLSGQTIDGTTSGASLVIGRGGGNGTVNITNNSVVTITNTGSAGAGIFMGGTSGGPTGNGTLNVTDSAITVTAAPGLATARIGFNGTGTATFTRSTLDLGDGHLIVAALPGSIGTLTIGDGSKVFANTAGIGGSSDTNAGGVGNVVVTGAGSQLTLAGDSGFLGVGRNGTGSLTVSSQGEVAATIINVGRAAGGVGTMSVDNGIINLSGQQTSGSQSGAGLSIGNRDGSGSASITNGSVLTITNLGSAGAGINVGGTPINPLGTGTLTVSNSTINVNAAPGRAIARIGHDGSGTATFTNSTLNVGDGQLIIAGQPGSTGTLTLSAGSVVNAGYVGVGATPTGLPAGTYAPQNPGGTATLVVNNSTVNAISTFEIGALGTLTGNNGVINVLNGDVIIGGTISPGQSPGSLRINCNLVSLDGSRLILEIQGNGSGGYDIDQLVIGDTSTFNLKQFEVVFSFLGDTDPTAFAASGGFDLDNFLLAGHFDGRLDDPLSTLFTNGKTWDDVVDFDRVTAESSVFDIASLSFDRASGGVGVIAAPIPEPSTWALMIVGFLVIATRARRLRRGTLTSRGHVAACS